MCIDDKRFNFCILTKIIVWTPYIILYFLTARAIKNKNVI